MRTPNPLRSAFGSGPSFSAVQFGAQGLFNNSTGAHLLRVWMVNELNNSTGGLFVTKTQLTGSAGVGSISPAVTDEKAPPGRIDQQSYPVAPVIQFAVPNFFAGFNTGNSYPFCVLRPGWTLVFVENVAAGAIRVSFYWDYVYAEEILTLSAGDSANHE